MKISIEFAQKVADGSELLIVLAGEERALGQTTIGLIPESLFNRASEATNFSGKSLATLDLVAPEGLDVNRLVLVGTGDVTKMEEPDWTTLGGKIGGVIKSSSVKNVTVVIERPDGQDVTSAQLMEIAGGITLRNYTFDRHKTKKDKDNGDVDVDACSVTIVCEKASEATKEWSLQSGVFDGVMVARDLVNEPANVLGPIEFAERARELEKLGVEVEILTEKEMSKLKMGALLGVAQGAERPPRLAIMKWMGGKKKDKPVSFIGKGVVFDTGGISIKPAGGMEDMKGDMGGAAAVLGLMHALASRKAKANVIGAIGLVENMPDGKAQRPGDIVTSMSGQTIEIINTDAEGRLVLCDVLHYIKENHDPEFMINLATLTGAIIIALGHHNAGLFCNDDDLALKIAAAGNSTAETVWRLPLHNDYDKLIESKFADMKNTGTRAAGSITAAQFLKRFVGDTPWAHLDVAGVAFGSPQTEINKSWASGYGVRLLDRLVLDNYG